MEDLIFTGFVVFKNKLKNEAKKIIETMRKMKCGK